MKIATTLVALLFTIMSANCIAADSKHEDALCTELKEFLESVNPDESRSITLHTFWGIIEEGDKFSLGSKHCEHNDYEPGVRLCSYFVANSSTEFAGYNAKRVLSCLTPPLGLPEGFRINSGSFSASYGSPDRGALVEIDLRHDDECGGMALRIEADGY